MINRIDTINNTRENTLTIFIQGKFNFELVEDFRSTYEPINTARLYIVDLKEVTHFYPAGLGMLIDMYIYLHESNPKATINLVNTKKEILQVFDCIGLSGYSSNLEIDKTP